MRYFASLRERMGRAEELIAAEEVATVADVWARVKEGKALAASILVAVNMEYADLNCTVKDGDEVAFFPPVTGG